MYALGQVIGTCSICGGPVGYPATWMGIHPPPASCGACGAEKANPYGPVIQMQPSGVRTFTSTTYRLPNQAGDEDMCKRIQDACEKHKDELKYLAEGPTGEHTPEEA